MRHGEQHGARDGEAGLGRFTVARADHECRACETCQPGGTRCDDPYATMRKVARRQYNQGGAQRQTDHGTVEDFAVRAWANSAAKQQAGRA